MPSMSRRDERGNSVYFPRRVIPMLPEALSNELCSLKPEVDRLVMVCEMDIGAHGAVQDYKFYPGVIHSKARLTYTRVAAVLEGRVPEPPIEAELHPAHRGPRRCLQVAAGLARQARRHRLRFASRRR